MLALEWLRASTSSLLRSFHLKGHYQNQTCADTTKLRRAGSTLRFRGVEEGVKEYMAWLEDKEVMIKSSPISHAKKNSA
ncbi:unnamed protein product [Penicillium salamii]|uniref:Uncharacterized protein n=1 Tax=Penicillium salamii TaxID=1612424 RepID=A0A9W4IHX4_9EURO|nr:unnamed protein product [Penicillium salamii]CAG8285486.1 unnamed protein product [Penicillium salamii]CAG8287208.1 unnamed protein product [Penicillium salamii]CAG8398715.1 unnamed protein product [Penicillium salamii]CAG8420036.1 unnamed protein product [Penicillium salamii]